MIGMPSQAQKEKGSHNAGEGEGEPAMRKPRRFWVVLG
jgi:hypothetical protein